MVANLHQSNTAPLGGRFTLERRGLTLEEAADYLGLTASGFQVWVRKGLVPGPISGTHRWDRKALDIKLDRQSGLDSKYEGSDYEKWKARRNARPA